jgi:hypothetical protein
MTPLVTLYIIPIGLIAIVIIAIIRLIIRAANSGNSNNTTNYTNYNQPPNPGQHNPYNQGQNPYGQNPNPYNTNPNPYSTNPYNTNPNPYNTNPTDPNSPPPPPSWQNPGTYQQPDYTQQNQPNYAPSTYNEPGTYNPQANTRSTSIGNTNYSTHVGAPVDQGKSPALKIILIIVGVVVLLGAGIAYVAYQRNEGGASLTSSSFRLAYDNPTENTYYIVLDEWDTIKVDPYTSSEDLDYTHRRDLTVHHWQMLDEDYKVIADTTVTKEEMEDWESTRTAYYWNYSTVIFNPSATQYVYYNSWFDEEGLNYMDDFKVGDSTYFADAYTVNDMFIFDGRDPEFQTDLDAAATESEYEQQQFLLNRYDFVVLYHKLNYNDPQEEMMEEYLVQLQDLYEVAKEEVMYNNAYDSDDLLYCYSLDSMTPSWISDDTEPRDFIPAIEFVKDHSTLFKATAREQYNYIVDSADALLKHSYTVQDRPDEFMNMTVISYSVYKEGMFNDEGRREESWTYERNKETGSYY